MGGVEGMAIYVELEDFAISIEGVIWSFFFSMCHSMRAEV